MKALLCKEYGPPESLTIEEVADPVAGDTEVVIDIHAASVNFPDTLMIQGKYQMQPPMPFTPGSEVAGVISAIGSAVDNVKVGDRVIAMIGNGGFAEKTVVDSTRLFTLPESMSYAEGASFPMIYGTSWFALKQRANIKAGDVLLVTGAGGGVGYSAVELGKAAGAHVIAAASTDEKLALAKQAGADEVINYSESNLKEKIKELTGGRGVDIAYDPVGGELFEQCLRGMAWDGRLLVIGFTGGIPKPPMNLPLLKNCDIVGVFWGAWTAREPVESQKNFAELFELFSQKKLKPPIADIFEFEQAAAAIKHLADRKAKGKVIVQVRTA